MKITSVDFSFIKAFKSLSFDFDKTSVIVGQNDHGKSSILKSIDIVLNQINEAMLDAGTLHPDLAEVLLPIFQVNAKARRITINYQDGKNAKQLYITIRTDFSFTLQERIERGAKTTEAAKTTFQKLREANEFVLIPALRDASSDRFKDLFSKTLRDYGLAKIIPQKAGGTPREYRLLKEIRDKVTDTIGPFINEALLPQIERHFGFETQHKLALKFDVDVQDIGGWVIDNLRLGFNLGDDGKATLALSEAGTGVQSGVLLALHRLGQKAADNPNKQYILAVEEPEAFLHPQKQKELFQNIRNAQSSNLKIIVTTHSPYIVSEAPFSHIGLVKKVGLHAEMHVAQIGSPRDQEIFDAYSNDVNASLFFAEKVILVEGESDVRVIKKLLEMHLGAAAHRVSVLSASGNRNFSPFLKMIRAWQGANIPHLVVTDFDSLTKSGDRAILVGAKAAGYSLGTENVLLAKIDSALDKGEGELEVAAIEAGEAFSVAGLNVFVFSVDLEFSLITAANKVAAAKILNESSGADVDYSVGYDIASLQRLIGSKGISLNAANEPPFKRPFIHKKIAETIELKKAHPDIGRLLEAIKKL